MTPTKPAAEPAREDVTRAHQLWRDIDVLDNDPEDMDDPAMQRVIAIIARALTDVRREERERCAGVAARWKSPLRPAPAAPQLVHAEAAREISAAIRRQDDGEGKP